MHLAEIKAHLSRDVDLRKLIQNIDLNQIILKDDLFTALVESIVSQQVSTAAARTIYGRLTSLFTHGVPDPREVLQLDPEDMRAVGVSRQKSGYIKNIASFFTPEKRPLKYWIDKSDEEVIGELTSIKGVGVWTVQMILIFSLGREDVFPSRDLGIQNGMKKLYGWTFEGKDLISNMERKAEHWRPYRSHASRLLWKYVSVAD